MTPDAEAAAVGQYVDALLACTASVSQILDHMLQSPREPSGVQAARMVRGLLILVPHPPAARSGPAVTRRPECR